MEHALFILFGLREVVRQTKELIASGYVSGSARAVVCSNFLNMLFGVGACIIGLAGYWPVLLPWGWVAVGSSLLIGTQVPCGFVVVNHTPWMWVVRQILFVVVSGVCFAHALGCL